MQEERQGWIVSVNVGPGGVPRFPRPEGDRLTVDGLAHDARAFQKHNKPARALNVLSMNLLESLQADGYRVAPGIMAESLTVAGLDVMALPVGTRLVFESGAEAEVTGPRHPCYQLNPVGEGLEQAAVGRSGVMCSCVTEGDLKAGMRFRAVIPAAVNGAANGATAGASQHA